MHAKMAATLMRALVFFIVSINVLAFKDRHNALNGNLTCYSNCWTAKPAISHSFVLNHRLKRCVVRWDSRGLVYLAAPEDSVLLSTLLTMPDIVRLVIFRCGSLVNKPCSYRNLCLALKLSVH